MKTTRILAIPRLRSGWRACRAICVLTLGLMVCQARVGEAAWMGSAFTYQGRLIDNNQPADGLYDFQFKLFDDPDAGSQQGDDVNVADIDVIDGYFTVLLDFGDKLFDGDARWLEIGVRPGDSNDPNAFVTLSPRQKVTPTPYALYAMSAPKQGIYDVLGTPSSGLYLPGDAGGRSLYNLGNVGIGTATPAEKLTVEGAIKVASPSTASPSAAILGEATGASGFTFGVWGDSNSPDGTGVYGHHAASTGTQPGIRGVTESNSGGATGISGLATADSGATYGVLGESDSDTGTGVRGWAKATSGQNYGVYGQSSSNSGTGIYGVALANSGTTYGVYGYNNSPDGTGVYGEVSDTGSGTGKGGHFKSGTSTGRGVYGEATGSSGRGVYGSATNSGDFTNYGGYFTAEGTYGRGVYARASGTDGRGVYGYASNTGDVENYGGRFVAAGAQGRGVYGEASKTGAVTNYGGYFEAAGNWGVGVAGLASYTGTSTNYGGYFVAEGVYGKGIYGNAGGSSGQGVRGYGGDYDFYAAGPGTNYGPFTGGHEVKLSADFPANVEAGMIVSVTGQTQIRQDEDGDVSISSALPTVKLSEVANDKAVFGVLVKEGPLDKEHWYKADQTERFATVNALGEGRVWVSNINGEIEAGDYITTSAIPGYGQKQYDNLLRSCTLGKAIETVDWDSVTETIKFNGQAYKIYLIAVVYTSG